MRRIEATIGAVALPAPAAGTNRRKGIALAVTIGAHAALAVGVMLAPVRDKAAPARPSKPLHVVEIAAAPPPPPPPPVAEPEPPPPAPVPAPVRAAPVAKAAARPAPPAEKPPAPGPVAPAQAGKVVAAAPQPEMLDFTSFDIASGDGASYVGGVTSAAGTNTVAVHGGDVEVGARNGAPAPAKSQARSVRLPGRNWDCPWPDGARALREREQEVVLRAVVEPDGRAASVQIVSDPGNGFGEAALRCAKRVRFEPARDAAGNAVAANSPPIRVKFFRR